MTWTYFSKALKKTKLQQESLLQVGKKYLIIEYLDRNITKKTKAKVLGVYDNYYLLENDRGQRFTLLKVDYHLGEWSYKEIS